jgi:hypothetical protein
MAGLPHPRPPAAQDQHLRDSLRPQLSELAGLLQAWLPERRGQTPDAGRVDFLIIEDCRTQAAGSKAPASSVQGRRGRAPPGAGAGDLRPGRGGARELWPGAGRATSVQGGIGELPAGTGRARSGRGGSGEMRPGRWQNV